MRGKLADLLRELVAKHNALDRQVNERFSRVEMPPSGMITNRNDYDQFLASFYWHLYCPEMEVESNWNQHHRYIEGKAFNLLQREYGPNARIRTFDLARSGSEGGLLAILRTLRQLVLDEFFVNQTNALVDHYWRNSTNEEILADGRDYLAEYGDMLPQEMAESSGAAILANYRKVLAQHPMHIHKLRSSIRF